MTEGTRFRATLLILFNALILALASPVFMPQFLPGGTGRNIRHLPCVSRRTGETGVCMFAFTCAKANGTHLGTCIDRFYFGSCCRIDDEPDIYPHDNTIDDGPVKPYLTKPGSIEHNKIPDYSSKPTPKPTQVTTGTPVRITDTTVRITQSPIPTTQKPGEVVAEPLPATTRTPISELVKVTANATDKYMTRPLPDATTESVGLSTFQTVEYNPSKTTPTPRPIPGATTKTTEKMSTTESTTNKPRPRPPVNKPTPTVKPNQKPNTQNTTKIDGKPISKPSVHKPSSVKPPVAQSGGSTTNKVRTTTEKPTATTTTQSTISGTRFPPRNATTTTTTTQKPSRPTPNRRPTPTPSKKPTSAPVRRTTTTTTTTTSPISRRPTTERVTFTSRPSTAAGIRNTTTETGSSLSTKLPTTSSISHVGNTPTPLKPRPSVTGGRPTSATPPVVNKQTTKKPSTSSTRPKPSPTTPSGVANPSRPTVTTLQPPPTRPSPSTAQVQQTLTTITPLEKLTLATTVVPDKDTPVTQRPASSSSQPGTTSSSLSSLSTSSISNEVISQDDTTNQVQGVDTSKLESTTYPPSLVTWTSNSDDVTTRSPVLATSTTEEPTNTEWTPITTPDGWILIQSPSPNESDKNEGNPNIRPTTQSPISDQPTTVPSTTTERSSERPSLPTAAVTPLTTDNDIPTVELNMSDYKQVCGRRFFPESRIVGGARSSFGKWPWQISLRQWRTSTYLHKCGAALLNENWAITAAHCVENVPPSDLLLRLGEHDLASEDEPYGFQERRVQIVASHPQFDPRTFEYDLALLRFYEPLLPFQPNTLPICLPDDDANYVGLTAHVTGWGRLYEDGPLPSILQEVPVPVINNTVCEAMYRSAGYIEHIPKIFICAGWRKGGFDSCEGDSGGPLVIQRPRDKRWILAGVISWGIGCAEPNQPGVYTRISEFREWINQILQF